MALAEVVQLRDSPSLSDIAGQMRALADRIESGEVEATSVLCIIPQDGDWPLAFGWGEHMNDLGNIAACELAKAFFINFATQRARP